MKQNACVYSLSNRCMDNAVRIVPHKLVHVCLCLRVRGKVVCVRACDCVRVCVYVWVWVESVYKKIRRHYHRDGVYIVRDSWWKERWRSDPTYSEHLHCKLDRFAIEYSHRIHGDWFYPEWWAVGFIWATPTSKQIRRLSFTLSCAFVPSHASAHILTSGARWQLAERLFCRWLQAKRPTHNKINSQIFSLKLNLILLLRNFVFGIVGSRKLLLKIYSKSRARTYLNSNTQFRPEKLQIGSARKTWRHTHDSGLRFADAKQIELKSMNEKSNSICVIWAKSVESVEHVIWGWRSTLAPNASSVKHDANTSQICTDFVRRVLISISVHLFAN